MRIRGGGRRSPAWRGAVLAFALLTWSVPGFYTLSSGEEKVYLSGSNYIFSGNWTLEEIKTITRLQDKAKEILEECRGYVTPEERDTILQAYRRPIIVHIKNNNLGKNIGASTARTGRSTDSARHVALSYAGQRCSNDLSCLTGASGQAPPSRSEKMSSDYSSYSAMQINVKELFFRGEKEILRTLLHEMAHNASPSYTHPPMNEIVDLYSRKPKPGRKRGEYYESVPVRVESCVRTATSTWPIY